MHPPAFLIKEESPVYVVRAIVYYRSRWGQFHEWGNWEGYDPEACSWIPAEFHYNLPDYQHDDDQMPRQCTFLADALASKI